MPCSAHLRALGSCVREQRVRPDRSGHADRPLGQNAILIVEFAKAEVEGGKPIIDAALAAARLRLRPILMTAFAFILGVLPLAIASGAGAVGRQIMGTAVIGGMLAATVIGIFLIPVSFYVVERLSHREQKHAIPVQQAVPATK